MKIKYFKQLSLILAILLIAMILSYWNVRKKTEKIFEPFLEKELYYYGTQFQPFTLYYENDKIIKWYGPNWYVSYDFQTLMTSGALSIRFSLLGKILDTNPGTLLQDILPKKLNLKKK